MVAHIHTLLRFKHETTDMQVNTFFHWARLRWLKIIKLSKKHFAELLVIKEMVRDNNKWAYISTSQHVMYISYLMIYL